MQPLDCCPAQMVGFSVPHWYRRVHLPHLRGTQKSTGCSWNKCRRLALQTWISSSSSFLQCPPLRWNTHPPFWPNDPFSLSSSSWNCHHRLAVYLQSWQDNATCHLILHYEHYWNHHFCHSTLRPRASTTLRSLAVSAQFPQWKAPCSRGALDLLRKVDPLELSVANGHCSETPIVTSFYSFRSWWYQPGHTVGPIWVYGHGSCCFLHSVRNELIGAWKKCNIFSGTWI